MGSVSAESSKEGLSVLELGSGILVIVATAHIMIAHAIPQIDNLVATNAPEIAGSLMLWGRVGAALVSSAAGAGTAWV